MGEVEGCAFCRPDPDLLIHESEDLRLVWDAFPVTPGHVLVTPRRHVEGWFEATEAEHRALMRGVERARRAILERHGPTDFNIGVNVGAAAGQTVSHLHVHVIPRRPGDVADPRGGVRHVIPTRGNYLRDGEPSTDGPLRALIRGGDDALLPQLQIHLDAASSADIAVAFVLDSGVDLLSAHLEDLLDRGGRLRFLTGDYLQVTSPSALRRLLDLAATHPEGVDLRVFQTSGSSFHPKAYLFGTDDAGQSTALVGSSNLTAEALVRGVEWNMRVVRSRDHQAFSEVRTAFEELFRHPNTRSLTEDWVDEYEPRWRPPPKPQRAPVEIAGEELAPVPTPHEVQREALAALERTRSEGAGAGLVVLATGLGKTWLAAFDGTRAGARRVLFVAHREEVLRQARDTFRRIRPRAHLGFYSGQDRTAEADVVFASIQTLGRARHLETFDPEAFDYIVVDEFHHAAASTYRRLLSHFRPRFLLGLTATPERTDGGDLLALCGENLAYRCDFSDGIERGILSPFRYYGVPDEIDYAQIPWRGRRFDEDELERAVATQERARNALDQYRRLAGGRTLAFCVSKRHADFMRDYFAQRGLSTASVHSGPTSDPRATSLERLRRGELDVVFSVDMFNEGVDVPDIDTVLMLRPTESRIVWLQQFGRGLRRAEGKDHLRVIDYIGNHRTFLTKIQALLELPEGDAHIVAALDAIQRGEAVLPPGCDVTYELEAVDILRRLARTKVSEQLSLWHRDFRQRHGVRPTASEVLHAGFNPRSLRASHGSWFGFVEAMGDLTADERAAVADAGIGPFLRHLETSAMSKSYKMVVLLSMIAADRFPGSINLDELTDEVVQHARRSPAVSADLSVDVEDRAALRALLRRNPVTFWSKGGAQDGGAYFRINDDVFSTTFEVTTAAHATGIELARELAEWRLAEYLLRETSPASGLSFTVNVSHAGGRPILFLPNRDRHPDVPRGWTPVEVDGEPYELNFAKVAVNVARRPGSNENVLHEVLRGWFGEAAGAPGTKHQVRFYQEGERLLMRPVAAPRVPEGP